MSYRSKMRTSARQPTGNVEVAGDGLTCLLNGRRRMLSSVGKPLAIAIPTGVRFARPLLPLIRALKLTGVSGAPTFSKAALGPKRHGC